MWPDSKQMTLPDNIKVALIHDWLNGMRGGEKCLEEIIKLFPEADLFTLIHTKGKLSPQIERMNIETSFIQRLPFSEKHYRYYLPFFPLAIESFDLREYQLVISTSHCVAKGVITRPETCHICYCFTPMRYAWDQYHSYFGHLSGPKASLMDFFLSRLRTWDISSSNRVDHFMTISHYVGRRIWKYYRRQAQVVYPPVDSDFFSLSSDEGSYYLVVSALTPYKRLDLVVKAAGDLAWPVKIVGTGPEEGRLRKMAGANVEFLGWLKQDDLRSAYQGCRAFLFPGEEDFGLTPLEAMSCGKPVIGFGRGGVTETVIPFDGHKGKNLNPTGVFFDSQDPKSLAAAVRLYEENRTAFDPDQIRMRALNFSPDRFRKSMIKAINESFNK